MSKENECPQCGEQLVRANVDNTPAGVNTYCEECGYPNEDFGAVDAVTLGDYKAVAEWLYGILDDIDTVSDMAKNDDGLYRKTVERIQLLKSAAGGSPDGRVVKFYKPSCKYGLTRLFSITPAKL